MIEYVLYVLLAVLAIFPLFDGTKRLIMTDSISRWTYNIAWYVVLICLTIIETFG